MPIFTSVLQSPLGNLHLYQYGEDIIGLSLQADLDFSRFIEHTQLIPEETTLFVDAKKQLEQYFAGKRQQFSLPLLPMGTPFQKHAWQALTRIPYGETISYQQQAEMLGNTNLTRAVGQANHRNPIFIIIPCHRVIGKNGGLTGFAGGLDIKSKLLEIEATGFNNNR